MFVGNVTHGEKKMKFERIIKFGMPFDKRNNNPKKNYGIRSMSIRFILKKGQKAVQIVMNTKLYLPEVIDEFYLNNKDIFLKKFCDGNSIMGSWKNPFECWDVGYHSNKQFFKGQSAGDCDILKEKKCFYDGSSLRGKEDKIAEQFLEKGEEFIWEYLEKYYKGIFENAN